MRVVSHRRIRSRFAQLQLGACSLACVGALASAACDADEVRVPSPGAAPVSDTGAIVGPDTSAVVGLTVVADRDSARILRRMLSPAVRRLAQSMYNVRGDTFPAFAYPLLDESAVDSMSPRRFLLLPLEADEPDSSGTRTARVHVLMAQQSSGAIPTVEFRLAPGEEIHLVGTGSRRSSAGLGVRVCLVREEGGGARVAELALEDRGIRVARVRDSRSDECPLGSFH